jgi:hypothetical protein
MTGCLCPLFCLAVCLVFGACPSGPSSSGPDGKQDTQEASTVERKIEFFDGLLSRRGTAARIMDDLDLALPERVRLTEVAYDSGLVQIKGKAPSNNLLADFVSRLEESPSMTEVMLQSSVQKSGRNGEFQEFALRARVEAPSGDVGKSSAFGSPAERLEALEKTLPARGETADLLRQLQTLASDSGLQVTGFTQGDEAAGEFAGEWPVLLGLAGSRRELRRFFEGLANLPRLWLVNKFSLKAVDPQDARSDVRASITAQTYFSR